MTVAVGSQIVPLGCGPRYLPIVANPRRELTTD